MAPPGKPINADVPLPDTAPAPPADPPGTRRRRRVPGALKAIGGLVAVAVAFIVAAIVGGSDDGGSIPSAAPTREAPPRSARDRPPLSARPSELGYPAFATNNTTRVGGPDPASNAAAVALAVYPSAAERQRPKAVTIVNQDDWQTAIAAAVLMAQPLAAPLLLSRADEVPDATAEALAILAPRGAKASRGAAAFAIGGAAVPGGLEVTAVGGTGAAGAASVARLRDRLFGSGPDRIVVASSSQPSFAMPAAAWAARSGDPILFSEADRLPPATADYLRNHPDAEVYAIGPPAAISTAVLRRIAHLGSDATRVSRVAGDDPVRNAIALARYDDGGFGWNVNDPGHGFVVTRSDAILNAVAAAPLSASGTWGPLLLTEAPDTLPAALRGYLLDVKPGYTTDPTRAFYNHVWVIGDEEAIYVNQQAEIDELAELARIGGAR